MSKLRLLNDQAIGEKDSQRGDGLDFKIYAKMLGNAALETQGPFTIGIFGEWGEGKTSLMQMIQTYLSEQSEIRKDVNDVRTVWFNAWRFEQEEHPIVPLVATIIRDLEQQKSPTEKLPGYLSSVVRTLRAIAYGFSAKSKVKIPGFAEIEAAFVAKDMITRDKELSQDPLLDRSLYYDAFKALSDVKLDPKVRIIIFIDDLDRCFPDRAIKLLESIKLILSQPGFIFFLGVSKKVIEGYLQHRYEKEYGIKDFEGQDYFHKIVQLPFEIPSHQERMATFSESLLESFDEKDREDFHNIIPIIGPASKNNPRATIRFLNNLLIDRAIDSSLAASKEDEIPIGFFAVTRGLQMSWESMYDLLERSSQELCDKIASWAPYFPIPNEIEENGESKKLVDEDNTDEVQAAVMINTQKGLHEFIHSEHGLQWLKDKKCRDAAIRFFRTQRPELYGDKRYDVLFIYSSRDNSATEVSQITEILKNSKLRVFSDVPIQPGEKLPMDIETAIKKAKAFAFCISPDWEGSEWKKTSLEIVLKARESIQIITIYLSGAKNEDVPVFLRDRPTTDFRGQPINETTMQRLIRILSPSLGAAITTVDRE